MQVGFIGLGIMGASMATNLQKAGYKLVVHDIRKTRQRPISTPAPSGPTAPRSWPHNAGLSSRRCPARPRSRLWRLDPRVFPN